MQQIFWETDFNRELEQILASHGVDPHDSEIRAKLYELLNLTRRASCQLMVEIDEQWKQKVNQFLEERSRCCK